VDSRWIALCASLELRKEAATWVSLSKRSRACGPLHSSGARASSSPPATRKKRAPIVRSLRREGYEVLEFGDGIDLTDYIVDYL